MARPDAETNAHIRFAADEPPSLALSAFVGAQTVVLILAGIALTPIIVARIAGVPPDWLIFAALLVCGVMAIVQARPVWIFGCGFVLFMGSNSAYLGVATDAIAQGGLPLMLTLIAVSGPAQILFSMRLGQLRQIITPAVGGVVVMLIAVSIVPIAFGLMTRPIAGVVMPGQQAAAAATFFPIVLMILFADTRTRLWAPIGGVLIGTATGAAFGMVDPAAVLAAPWIGLPTTEHPGLDLSFGPAFWALLPAFALVTVVGGIETFGDAVAVQKVSRRRDRAIDFRSVQGAINADGIGNTLSGLAGTVPNTVYSTSVAVVEITGVASRAVGLFGGAFLIALAFSPKVAAALAAIPSPVAGAYIFVLLILLFGHGLRLATEEGISFAQGFAVCTAFWIGTAVQNKLIFHESLPTWFNTIFGNGTTAGGATAILLMLLIRLGTPPGHDLRLALQAAEAPAGLQAFIREAGAAAGWPAISTARLVLVGEAALEVLRERIGGGQVRVALRHDGSSAELEIISPPLPGNLRDTLDLLEPRGADPPPEHLDTLRSLAASVEHRQFWGRDYLLLRVPVGGFEPLVPAVVTPSAP